MKISFLGDTYLDKPFSISPDLNIENCIFNLEHPVSLNGTPAENKVNLGAEKSYINETFSKQNILAVNLANNHIMDYGESAYDETLKTLKQLNIPYFGAGNTSNNFNNPLIIDTPKKVALLAYCCLSASPVIGSSTSNGAAPLKIELILKDIETTKSKADFIVVNLHWGEEEIKYPKPYDVNIAHKIIDAGADLIIGHHAHTIQSHEIYKNKKIFYGLGNFIMPNLDVPAKFDGKQFKSRYKKTQVKRNRNSLIVNLDDNFETSFLATYFDDCQVKNSNYKAHQKILDKPFYNLYVKFSAYQRMAEGFIKNPRIPTSHQIKYILGIK